MNGSASCVIWIAVWTRVVTCELLEGVLQRERVHHGGEHPHVVGAAAFDPRGLPSPPDVAATDHDRDLDAEIDDFGELPRRPVRSPRC